MLAALLILAFALPVSAQYSSIPERAKFQKMYMEYLAEQGYKPSIDRDGDVQFKHEGSLYYVEVNEDDPEYFRVVMICGLEPGHTNEEVLEAVNFATAKAKVCKVVKQEDRVVFSAEILLTQPEEFTTLLPRLLSQISAGLRNFRDKLFE